MMNININKKGFFQLFAILMSSLIICIFILYIFFFILSKDIFLNIFFGFYFIYLIRFTYLYLKNKEELRYNILYFNFFSFNKKERKFFNKKIALGDNINQMYMIKYNEVTEQEDHIIEDIVFLIKFVNKINNFNLSYFLSIFFVLFTFCGIDLFQIYTNSIGNNYKKERLKLILNHIKFKPILRLLYPFKLLSFLFIFFSFIIGFMALNFETILYTNLAIGTFFEDLVSKDNEFYSKISSGLEAVNRVIYSPIVNRDSNYKDYKRTKECIVLYKKEIKNKEVNQKYLNNEFKGKEFTIGETMENISISNEDFVLGGLIIDSDIKKETILNKDFIANLDCDLDSNNLSDRYKLTFYLRTLLLLFLSVLLLSFFIGLIILPILIYCLVYNYFAFIKFNIYFNLLLEKSNKKKIKKHKNLTFKDREHKYRQKF